MGKFFKIIIAMFIFVSFIYPIKNADFDFEIPNFDEVEYEDTQADTYENIICQNVKNALNNGSYSSAVVSAKIKYSDDEIEITSLDVGIPDEYDKDEVEQYLFDNTGFNAKVYYLGE